MGINYQEIAERAVSYAALSNIHLDFTADSFKNVDDILRSYYEHLSEYQGADGGKDPVEYCCPLWNIPGETLLRLQLGSQGYHWHIADGLQVLEIDAGYQMSPITKAHKRILNGPNLQVDGLLAPIKVTPLVNLFHTLVILLLQY